MSIDQEARIKEFKRSVSMEDELFAWDLEEDITDHLKKKEQEEAE